MAKIIYGLVNQGFWLALVLHKFCENPHLVEDVVDNSVCLF